MIWLEKPNIYFGKCILIDTVLSASDIVAEVALCYDTEIWTANRTYFNTERAKIETRNQCVVWGYLTAKGKKRP
jgi:hypothetical protein